MTDLYPLAENMIQLYVDKPGLVKRLIGKYWVQRQPLLDLYESSVYKKELVPIEDIPIEDKNRIWKVANGWCIGTIRHRTETAKIIYLLEYVTQKKIEYVQSTSN